MTLARQRHVQAVGLRPELRERYLSLHETVWPEVEERLRQSHLTNYSIFVLADQLIAYFEYDGDDFDRDQAAIAADPVTQEWWSLTAPCQQPLPEALPGETWADATEIWHLS